MAERHRVVILGGGFGGVYAARGLRHADVDVTVVSRESYFLFTPLLHEVATGSLAPYTIVEPLRAVLGVNASVVVGDVLRVRLADKVVETSAGDVPFDRLVVALGAETNFYGIPGAREHAMQLKTMVDAVLLKDRVLGAFEAAVAEPDAARREALLRFVVVGGGATGVELAAELVELLRGSLLPIYRASLRGAVPAVVLLQASDALLPPFSPPVRERALAALRAKGVDVRLNAGVTAVDGAGVTLAGGGRVDASVVAWVAGVRPVAVEFDADVARDRAGRLVVDDSLRLGGRADVYAIGDIACATPRGAPLPLPPFAQVATRQARYVAAALSGTTKGPFTYRHQGNLVSVGQWMAVAEIGPFRFWGHFAWWLWRTVYLTKFLSRRKKFTIALQWTINLVSPRDVTRICVPGK